MVYQRVSIGLLALLLCHILANAIVGIGGWWKAETDLSEKLLVYRSVDSIVEFQVPLKDQSEGTTIARTTEDGFRYRGHYYKIVSLEVHNDTLHIAGLETRDHSLWQADLLAFLDNHFTTSSDTGRKASELLKFLLKEYSPSSPTTLKAFRGIGQLAVRIPEATIFFTTRSASVHSPPPERTA